MKVPIFGRDGKTILDWKEAKRNRWCIEKAAGNIKIRQKESKEIRLDSPEQATKQRLQKQKFDYETKLLLDAEHKKNVGLTQKEESLTESLKSFRPKF